MKLSSVPAFETEFDGKTYYIAFAVDTLQVLRDQGLREVITCRITQSQPLAFYAGMTVRHPQDPISDDYYPHAKQAMKRALRALWNDYDGMACFSCMYSRFRYDLLHHRQELEKAANTITKPDHLPEWEDEVILKIVRREDGQQKPILNEIDETRLRRIIRNEIADAFKAD